MCWLNAVIQALAVTKLSLALQCIGMILRSICSLNVFIFSIVEELDQTPLQRKFIEVNKNLEKSSKSPNAYPIIVY